MREDKSKVHWEVDVDSRAEIEYEVDSAYVVVDVVHQNESYTVEVVQYEEPVILRSGFHIEAAYEVINVVTGVVEFSSTALPEAIHVAEQFNMTLRTKPWEWLSAPDDGDQDEDEEEDDDDVIASFHARLDEFFPEGDDE